MHNRVLDERLQHQRWNQRVEGLLGNGIVNGQSIKAAALNAQVATDQLQFMTQGRFLRGGVGKGGPKDFREIRDHILSGQGVYSNQRGYGVQGIEEKMRLNLCTQQRQTRFRQLGLEPSRDSVAIAGPRPGIEQCLNTNQGPIHPDIRVDLT